MATEQWAWAAQDRYPGYCVTFLRDREPATIPALLDADEPSTMTLAEAEQAYPITKPGSLLRCGRVGAWAFCFEDRVPIANRPLAIARLSQGTTLVQVTRGGDGMNIVQHLVDGRKIEYFEPSQAATPRGEGPFVLAPAVAQIRASNATTSGLVAALTAVGNHVGAAIDRHILDGPLHTALTRWPAM